MFDLIIIGGGPAGYFAAERAGQEGLNVLLIEKSSLGGVCLNEGCIPSKTLLYSAKLYDNAKQGERYGVRADNVSFDHSAVLRRKNKVVRILTAGIKAKLTANIVKIVNEKAKILGKTGDSFNIKAGDMTYQGKQILIATGSVPVIPPIPGVQEGLDAGYILTNRSILDLAEVPASLVIIGGGVIGLEMASYYNSAGSKVTVIEMLDYIGGFIDREIGDFLLKEYQKKGIQFKLSSRVTKVEPGSVTYESDGELFTIEADKALLSIGRRPATCELGLEAIGVELEKGRIKTDSCGRTNIPGIFAAGDVNGVSMLAHTAYREAKACINTILGNEDIINYDAVPSVIYTNPEVAGVGETEESAKKKGLDYSVKKLSMRYNGRFMAENEGRDGICKVLYDNQSQRILGIHIISSYASEIIHSAAMMIESKMTIMDTDRFVFPHPTVSEIISDTILS